MKLFLLNGEYNILKFTPDAWPLISQGADDFFSVTLTKKELSIVCEAHVHKNSNWPEPLEQNRSWKCLEVEGPLDFSLTGILNSIIAPLGQVGISIFAISTFDTDYLLVKEKDLEKTIETLQNAKFEVTIS